MPRRGRITNRTSPSHEQALQFCTPPAVQLTHHSLDERILIRRGRKARL
jgi:hypothetical protein